MIKTLVVYYSLTGNTKFIAEHIASELNADIEDVKPIKDLDPNSSSKYFWGGMKATMKIKPKLEDLKYNPLDYDLLIIGTPVWAWTLSPPIRSYCSEFDLKSKKVALFTSSDGNGVSAMNKYKDFMKDSDIVGEYRFISPLSNNPDQAKEKVVEWVKELMNKIQ
jgi:flavodoxin